MPITTAEHFKQPRSTNYFRGAVVIRSLGLILEMPDDFWMMRILSETSVRIELSSMVHTITLDEETEEFSVFTQKDDGTEELYQMTADQLTGSFATQEYNER